MKALRINTDRTTDQLDIEGLQEIRLAIGGGWIEAVPLPLYKIPPAVMYVDEEGRFKSHMQLNEFATRLAGQPILGPAVVFGTEPGDPDEKDVPIELVNLVEAWRK